MTTNTTDISYYIAEIERLNNALNRVRAALGSTSGDIAQHVRVMREALEYVATIQPMEGLLGSTRALVNVRKRAETVLNDIKFPVHVVYGGVKIRVPTGWRIASDQHGIICFEPEH